VATFSAASLVGWAQGSLVEGRIENQECPFEPQQLVLYQYCKKFYVVHMALTRYSYKSSCTYCMLELPEKQSAEDQGGPPTWDLPTGGKDWASSA
jgi:hypothetical protein